MTDRFIHPHQAKLRPSTPYEDLLGDALERAFGSGVSELTALVEYLNKSGPAAPNGQLWTPTLYEEQIAKMADYL
jgi:hypothetical protein